MRKGSKHTEESKAKMSAARTGKHHTEESKKKASASLTGKRRTEETKILMSQVRLGKPKSEEAKANMSKAKKGKRHSEETKAKMSRSWRPNAKHGRSTWYDVEMPDGSIQKVQGTYELRYARYLLSQGLTFIAQPKPSLKYTDQFGGTRKYNPDFWVHSLSSYVEIKSTYTLGLRGARKKLEMVQKAGHPLIILTEVELSEMGIDMKSKIE